MPSQTSRDRGRVLLTGGAGYIGSHTGLSLIAAGWDVIVVDDLSTGSRRLVPPAAKLLVGNVSDRAFVAAVLAEFKPEMVVHFAGSISVPESIADPQKYYANNFAASQQLIAACLNAGIRKIVFSSTAAVYGTPAATPVSEDAPTNPANPYGRSKLMTEWFLRDLAAAGVLDYVALRYFNVAGADARGRTGQISRNSSNLIKTVSELAVGRRSGMAIHGNDYATTDGTCIRDFIHVSDLATAHLAALEHLHAGGRSDTINCGYGRGYSVLDVVRAAEAIVGRSLRYTIGPRREGDIATMIADTRRIKQRLAWKPDHANLDTILRSAITWERGLLDEDVKANADTYSGALNSAL